jgi:hypothetical protein
VIIFLRSFISISKKSKYIKLLFYSDKEINICCAPIVQNNRTMIILNFDLTLTLVQVSRCLFWVTFQHSKSCWRTANISLILNSNIKTKAKNSNELFCSLKLFHCFNLFSQNLLTELPIAQILSTVQI